MGNSSKKNKYNNESIKTTNESSTNENSFHNRVNQTEPNKNNSNIFIKDDDSITNLNKELKIYDLVIYCNSFENMKKKDKGWYYKKSNQYEYKSKQKVYKIGIIGETKSGKSKILNNLIKQKNIELYSGIDFNTEGLSCKYHNFESDNKNCYLLFDTMGISEIIKKKNDGKIVSVSEEIQYVYDKSIDKKKIENFLLNFIIKNSDIIIFVLNTLTNESQEILNILKFEEFSKMFVIHNLINFYDKKSIDDYIEKTLNKINKNLKKISFCDFNDNEKNGDDFNDNRNKGYYFIENINNKYNDNKEKKIFHLIMGNDGEYEETIEIRKIFNENCLDFIKRNITNDNKESYEFNIIDKIKEELSLELKYEKNLIDNKYGKNYGKIFLKEDINLKNFHFEPNFSCYYLKKEKYLFIIIEVFGKRDKNLKVKEIEKEGSIIIKIEGNQEEYINEQIGKKKFEKEIKLKKLEDKINEKIIIKKKSIKFNNSVYRIKYHIETKPKKTNIIHINE